MVSMHVVYRQDAVGMPAVVLVRDDKPRHLSGMEMHQVRYFLAVAKSGALASERLADRV
jgi:hypothetical protein